MEQPHRIRCRVRTAPDCHHGSRVADIYPDGIDDDSTWDGETVICDGCYVAIGMPTVKPGGDPARLAGGRGRP